MKRWFVIFLAAPVVLWSAYWAGAAFFLKKETEALLQNQFPGQVSAQVSQTRVRGFPTDFQLNLADLTIQNTDMFAWTSPDIELNASSYSPQNIRMDIPGPQQIRSKLGDMVVTSDDLQVSLLVKPVLDLSLGVAQLDMKNARLVHDAGWEMQLEHLILLVEDVAATGSGSGTGTYDMDVAASVINLSNLLPDLPPTYDEIQALHASLGLEFTRNWDIGLLESGPPSLRKVTIQDGRVAFGESLIGIEGELGLNAENRVDGALMVELTGWRELISVLRNAGYVDPDIADMVVEFMDDQNQPDTLQLPLVIQDGQVRFGMFTLGTVPALP